MGDNLKHHFTSISRSLRVPKDVEEETFVQMHLVGCLVYCKMLQAKVFFNYPNMHDDVNLSITITHHIITSWEGPPSQEPYISSLTI